MTTVTPPRERWRAIPRHPGYEASDLGRVRSLDHVVTRSNGRPFTVHGRVLRPAVGTRGVPQVGLGGHRTRRVCQLVLEAFVGPCPPNKEACHWDDNPTDNRLENLRWGSRSDNQRDAVRNGRHNMAKRTHCPRDHPLVAPNLVAADVRSGKRSCRACARAQTDRCNALNAHLPLLLLADFHLAVIHIEAGLPLPDLDYARGRVAA